MAHAILCFSYPKTKKPATPFAEQDIIPTFIEKKAQ